MWLRNLCRKNDENVQIEALRRTVSDLQQQLEQLGRRGRQLEEENCKYRQREIVAKATRDRLVEELKDQKQELRTMLTAVVTVQPCAAVNGPISSEPAVDPDHVTRLRTQIARLVEQLNPWSAAAEMFQSDALTVAELEKIQCSASQCEASEFLIGVVLKAPREVYECFLQALVRSQQEHVYLLVVCDGYQTEVAHVETIRRHYVYLVETLDTKYSRLVGHLFAAGVLTQREKDAVEAELTTTRQNEKLLSVLSRKTPEQFASFLEALSISDQQHIRDNIGDHIRDHIVATVCDQAQRVGDANHNSPIGSSRRCLALRQLSTTATTSGVRGVAHLDGKLFVVCHCGDTINVFSTVSNEHVANIRVTGMQQPKDIVACAETGRLYVADWSPYSGDIWRLSGSTVDGRDVERWLPRQLTSTTPPIAAQSLSVTSSRLLVTTDNELRRFGPDGEELDRVASTAIGELQHAVETPRRTFIVAALRPSPRVAEIDSDGNVIHVCSDDIALERPCYLAWSGSSSLFDRLLVADFKTANVSLLNGVSLQLERVIADTVRNPWRILCVTSTCRSEQKLIVGCSETNTVREFDMDRIIEDMSDRHMPS